MVVLDVVVWGAWSAIAGYVAHRRPAAAFATDSWLYRLRRFERGGRLYEQLGIRRWKDRLPEAGALFTGGFSKRSVRSRDRDVLERFVIETRRAEWTHWTIMLITPVFLVWNGWWVEIAMVVYALAANLPCLLVQRYNRARLIRLLAQVPKTSR
ncbi:MAG: glycosyl-4,4-diaponeurosporenoate acyltransferase [Acidimicrobiaceae bacterium]|jgi:glycosyl-4,4'-diaponeurosporenoate acyltransferase